MGSVGDVFGHAWRAIKASLRRRRAFYAGFVFRVWLQSAKHKFKTVKYIIKPSDYFEGVPHPPAAHAHVPAMCASSRLHLVSPPTAKAASESDSDEFTEPLSDSDEFEEPLSEASISKCMAASYAFHEWLLTKFRYESNLGFYGRAFHTLTNYTPQYHTVFVDGGNSRSCFFLLGMASQL
eukprot:1940298-Rhodomonas_salina.1